MKYKHDFSYQLRLYIGYVGLKIFLGATAWMIAGYCIFDKFVSTDPISDWNYVLRNIVVGFADASFVAYADTLSTLIEEGTWKAHNWAGTGKL
jgi:hypothetical protein